MTGFDSVPADDRPPANTMLHWAFDTMVGICTVLIALGAWFGFVWWRRRDIPQTKWFLRACAVSGVAAVVALECGWIVTEVGRQPWIVYNVMRTSDAVTQASGIWVTFTLVLALYVALGATLIVSLRAMSRRWRSEAGDGRRRAVRARRRPPTALPEGFAVTAANAVAVVLVDRRDDVRGVRRRRLRGRALEPARRRRRPRPPTARADRLGDRAGVGGEPRLADLRPRRPVDGLPVRVRVDLLDAVHPAEPRRVRDRVPRSRLRVPAHRSPRPRPSAVDALFGASSVLTPFFLGTVVGAIAGGRVPVGNAAGDAVTSWVNPLSLVTGALFVATGAYLASVFLVSDARRAGTPDLERTSTAAR